jgi:hypothetical protein
LKSGKRPADIPSAPNETYKDKWKSWGDFLGSKNISNLNRGFKTFEESKVFLSKLKLKNRTEFRKYSKSGNRPEDIPSKPEKIYKEDWKGYKDFLGKED